MRHSSIATHACVILQPPHSLQAPTDPKDEGETLTNGGSVIPAKALANRLAGGFPCSSFLRCNSQLAFDVAGRHVIYYALSDYSFCTQQLRSGKKKSRPMWIIATRTATKLRYSRPASEKFAGSIRNAWKYSKRVRIWCSDAPQMVIV